jgi:hypothetical protein
MKKTTQEQIIIQLLIEGWTNPIEAFKSAGTLKLSNRVGELRADFEIKDRWVQTTNRFGNRVRYKEYKIVKPTKKALAKYGL